MPIKISKPLFAIETAKKAGNAFLFAATAFTSQRRSTMLEPPKPKKTGKLKVRRGGMGF